ncbi:xanthine dehydrogenase family protein subunit M [Pandoraea sp.]|uniref:FAD binding domain-containing protein n=1 Tax=Pandoraea sp. TaxID=1883445 RepID=UPI0011F775D8|nr:xanthine dehydrogenase family protein subunit M [Pandoraea sp.]TAL55634.1 MAG: xanthine dehydrogenase family protein subunit M [Pandoraea sp.]TAM16803.1 MAG: xanthine dehydrogenase family protein subunit M [Pandoraea sp.]
MKSFNYRRPADLADAAKWLAAHPEARLLAGGQSLLPAMKLQLAAPSDLIDLGALAALKGIRVDGTQVVVGAMTSHAEVAASSEVRRAIPALAALADGIGDRQVRNRGTLGGSLANNDPAACYPAAVLGLGAVVRTDRREIAADAFFLGMYETALAPDEIITAVAFPVPRRAAYLKFRQPASRFALVGVFVSDGPQGVRVAVTGAGPCVFRASALEAALGRQFSADALRGTTFDPATLNSDMHASAEYRAHLIPVLAGRAVTAALAA